MKAADLITVAILSLPLASQSEQLQRAVLIEEQEHDLQQAARLYREIAESTESKPEDKTTAWYRLGRVLRRLGKNEEAQKALDLAAEGEGPAAASARALLQDKGQDKEKELRAKARAILDARPQGFSSELLWIGPTAVPEIIKEFEPTWRRGDSTFVGLVWELGGKYAKVYLSRALREKDRVYRQAVANGITHKHHPELLSEALQFMDDTALPGELTLHIAKAVVKKKPMRLLKLTQSKQPQVAAEAWDILTTVVGQEKPGELVDAGMPSIIPALKSSLDRTDSEVAERARWFLMNAGMRTRSGRELLLELLPHWPRNQRPAYTDYPGGTIQHPASLPSVLRTALKLGEFDAEDKRAAWLQALVGYLSPHWKREDMRDVLELVRLGYFRAWSEFAGIVNTYPQWFAQHAKPEDAMTFLEKLDGSRHLLPLIGWLPENLPKSAWPLLLRCWEKIPTEHKRGHAGAFFLRMGGTGSEAALPFLLKNLRGSADLFDACCQGLIALSNLRDTPAVREALRTTLRLRYDKHDREEPQKARLLAFQRLLELGDFDTVRLMPQLVALGWESCLSSLHETWDSTNRRLKVEYGFDEQALAKAWSFLLDQDERYWSHASRLLVNEGEIGVHVSGLFLWRIYHGRKAVIQVLVSRLRQTVDAALESKTLLPEYRYTTLVQTLNLPGHCQSLTPDLEASIQSLTTRCLESGVPKLQKAALAVLQLRWFLPKQRSLAMQLLSGANEETAMHAYKVIHRERLSKTEFKAILDKAAPAVRSKLLSDYLENWEEKAVSTVQPFADDVSESVRVGVCKYLGRCANVQSIPPLLKLLRDPMESVRKAAQEALRSIRFYHEQKAHWDRAFAGPQVDANSAAEALLKQADPKEKKATRLLAIRSLGLLGKVETLPFLINYTKEKDAEIAAAAQKAIQIVHELAAKQK